MNNLHLNLDSRALFRLKAGLRRTMPGLKSSYRTEALARGLGFPTHASLLARLKVDPLTAVLNPGAFTAFLTERGVPSTAAALMRAAGHAIIAEVLERDERLHLFGWGRGSRERRGDGRIETVEERNWRFRDYRAQFRCDDAADQVLRSIALLSQVPATKTIRPDTDSYRLKHIAENLVCAFPDGEPLGPAYVTNGALIVAAAYLGFRYQTGQDPAGADWPNVTFNMSQSHLNALDVAIRPNGARAQTRRRLDEIRAQRARFMSL